MCEVVDMFINLIMVIISQCTCISSHYMLYLKFAQYIVVNDILHHCDMLHHSITIISIKLEKILMPAPTLPRPCFCKTNSVALGPPIKGISYCLFIGNPFVSLNLLG